METNNLLNAGLTVSVDNSTYYKLFGTAVAMFLAFFIIKRILG